MKNLISHTLLVVLMSSCAVGPSTKVPVATPAPLSSQDTTAQPAARSFIDSLAVARQAEQKDSGVATLWKAEPLALDSLGDVAWLSILRDSTLVSLVNTAVANNRDLRIAIGRVREFRALNGVGKSDLYPQLDASAYGSKNKVVFGSLGSQTYDAVLITGNLSWELDFWGRLRRQAEASRFDYEAEQEDRRATVVSLVSDVATAYLELRELDEDLRISEETLASRETTLALAQKRFKQGVISELDVRQFEAQAAVPAAAVADFMRQRRQKENALSVLLGQEPGPIGRGAPLSESVQAVAVPDSVPSSLLMRRPDVLRAEREWSAATARIGVAIGNRLPKVMLTGQYGTQRPDFSGLFAPSGEIYQLQGGITIPLFTGGRLLNQQRAAEARADQARNEYERTVLTSLQEGSDALAATRAGRYQLVAQETQVRALRRAMELSQTRYNSGVSSYLEVLDAQRTLFVAELALVQTQRQYLASTVQLYKALGGSWVEEGTK
jgi:multidrug efflux system outer membrane protein